MTGSGDQARSRLRSQGVSGQGHATVAAAASAMLATQAQDFHAAKWALALRSTGREADVDAALASGAVVRTWPMRGTLMFLARDDVRWVTELLAPRSYIPSAGIWRGAGLDESHFERAAAVARDVLSGGRALGRKTLLAEMEAAGLDTSAGRGSHLVRRIAGDGVLVFGAPRGTEQTFVLLDDWAPAAERRDRDDGLRILAARYVRGHGPATVQDLAWWSGLTLTDARRAVELAGEAIERDAAGMLVAPGSTQGAGSARLPRRGDVRLLGSFDEILLGYRDRSAALTPEQFALVAGTANGLFLPTVMLDGRVIGVWRRSTGRAGVVDVDVNLFTGSAAGESDVEDPGILEKISTRADEYAVYLGRELRLTWGDAAR